MMDGRMDSLRYSRGDVTEEVYAAQGQKPGIFGYDLTFILSAHLTGTQTFQQGRTMYISRETYQKLAPRFAESPRPDRYQHTVAMPTPTTFPPLPSW